MVKKTPSVSVVMCSYNSEKYISESIESILNQKFKDFEFIIVDDGSTEDTLKVIKKLAKKDRRIRLVINEKNKGVPYSTNKGRKLARGKYLAIMDSDDISLKNRLQVQFNYLTSHPEVFLIGGSYEYIDEKGNFQSKEKRDYSSEELRKRAPYLGVIHNPTIMFRNEGNILVREKFRYASDQDFLLRLISDGKKLVVLPEFVLKYRLHKNSISQDKHLKQMLFLKNARNFYYERLKKGKDSYDEFDEHEILGVSKKDNRDYSIEQVIIALISNQKDMGRVRERIKQYWNSYGFFVWPLCFGLYLASFTSISVRKKLKVLAERLHLH